VPDCGDYLPEQQDGFRFWNTPPGPDVGVEIVDVGGEEGVGLRRAHDQLLHTVDVGVWPDNKVRSHQLAVLVSRHHLTHMLHMSI
jgi:hypothetical protein